MPCCMCLICLVDFCELTRLVHLPMLYLNLSEPSTKISKSGKTMIARMMNQTSKVRNVNIQKKLMPNIILKHRSIPPFFTITYATYVRAASVLPN